MFKESRTSSKALTPNRGGSFLFFIINKTIKHDEKENEREWTTSKEVPRSNGWACHQAVVLTDADGGLGTEDGADGEADNELCVSVELGALGTETGIGAVEGKP